MKRPDERYPNEIGPEDLVTDPVMAFGVEQGGYDLKGIAVKLRRILNWKWGNL